MKQKTTIKTFIMAAAVSLGLASAASAQSASVAVPAPADTTAAGGLLGSRYTRVEYDYVDFTGGSPSLARGFGVSYNQPLRENFDLNLSYDWARAKWSGVRFTQQDFQIGTTAYTNLSWGRPFAQAAVGWSWQDVSGVSYNDDSFTYTLGVGTEFQVAPAVTVTPFVNFARATGYNATEFQFGAEATYRINREWSVTARAQYDSTRHATDAARYALGVNYHF
jgi:opacity protein-like surface antigen